MRHIISILLEDESGALSRRKVLVAGCAAVVASGGAGTGG